MGDFRSRTIPIGRAKGIPGSLEPRGLLHFRTPRGWNLAREVWTPRNRR